MKGAIITLAVLGYLAGFGLTFGFEWNRSYAYRGADIGSVVSGAVWPFYWIGWAGIELTKVHP